ncbi:pentapeptide repeat-containing protein [Streptomyces actuosus]|uniref:Pentapeptide repeat-containing protein n=2 Tax=Streptomyces actuosus TaxID=1885 RepID=A0ABS2VWL2_STRAS|nr:pentapeptide repeat-containing protein [Streptomyces actuosus]
MSAPHVRSGPSWPHCGHGASPADPTGCRGIHVPGLSDCLAHLTDADRTAYLAELAPGADIDHRGTPFTEPVLRALLGALRDPAMGKPLLGNTRFDEATFTGPAGFDGATFTGLAAFAGVRFTDHAELGLVTFSGPAGFVGATFDGSAGFHGATFSDLAAFGSPMFNGSAGFGSATFNGSAGFDGTAFTGPAAFTDATFTGLAAFAGATFTGPAQFSGGRFAVRADFGGAVFTGPAGFDQAAFCAEVRFDEATFAEDARFRSATFPALSALGPLTCTSRVDLSESVFGAPVTVEIAAAEVQCVRTRWESTATLRLRYATVDLSRAVLSAPAAVMASPRFTAAGGHTVDETPLDGRDPGVKVTSVHGVDAAHLVLAETDLSDCLFSGAFHLDQLRLEGTTTFAPAPTGIHLRHRIWPYRWSQRRCLAEEHHWRAQAAPQPATQAGQPSSSRLWRTGRRHTDTDRTPTPQHVAAVYRQLRKAFEDGKNEPGAADFYYGETEMRRHDRTGTSRAERGLLFWYWLLSGYGLRSSRAMSWLLAAMTTTVLLLVLWGLPTHTPDLVATGTLTHGRLTLTTTTPDPTLTGPWHQRLTTDRAEQATRIVLNSVIFRASGQNLTTAGTYIEMTSRLLEPMLLALAALAVRGRIRP